MSRVVGGDMTHVVIVEEDVDLLDILVELIGLLGQYFRCSTGNGTRRIDCKITGS